MSKYQSVKEFAESNGVSERTVRNYCAEGKIPGAFLTGKTWNIPVGASMPERKNVLLSPLDLYTFNTAGCLCIRHKKISD